MNLGTSPFAPCGPAFSVGKPQKALDVLDSRQLDPEVHSRSDGDCTTDTFMPIALCIRTLATHADSCQIALLFMRGQRLEFQNDSQELIYHDLVFD